MSETRQRRLAVAALAVALPLCIGAAAAAGSVALAPASVLSSLGARLGLPDFSPLGPAGEAPAGATPVGPTASGVPVPGSAPARNCGLISDSIETFSMLVRSVVGLDMITDLPASGRFPGCGCRGA